mmetsp:Transcript_108100/g.301429  ORF Transcript_108100/g.301429 Transcript_108100/m.301429 type:complete len:222 (+) Transcript_108100:1382-2047(+)
MRVWGAPNVGDVRLLQPLRRVAGPPHIALVELAIQVGLQLCCQFCICAQLLCGLVEHLLCLAVPVPRGRASAGASPVAGPQELVCDPVRAQRGPRNGSLVGLPRLVHHGAPAAGRLAELAGAAAEIRGAAVRALGVLVRVALALLHHALRWVSLEGPPGGHCALHRRPRRGLVREPLLIRMAKPDAPGEAMAVLRLLSASLPPLARQVRDHVSHPPWCLRN